MNNQPNPLSHLVWALGGGLLGSWMQRNALEYSKKSRAEIDFPEETAEAYEEIGKLLDEWEPDAELETEEEFTQDLAEYLDKNSDYEIEVCPNTSEGYPDILIDDLIALELKVDLRKSERDRCIGQCAGYSRQWITWIVLIDTPASKVGGLEKLLADKGLDQIAVWSFS